MKVIRKDRIIDLDRFDKVAYRKGTFWEEKEYYVDAVRQERNFDCKPLHTRDFSHELGGKRKIA